MIAWYWWVSIGIGCVTIYARKVVLLKRWQKSAKMEQERKDREQEDA